MQVEIVRDALVVVPNRQQEGLLVLPLMESLLDLPQGFCRTLFAQKRVVCGSVPAVPDTPVKAGVRIWFHGGIEEDPFSGLPVETSGGAMTPQQMPEVHQLAPVDVLYEDNHVLAINKPQGIIVYPGSEKDLDTLAHRVAAYYVESGVRRKVRHVHRLDKDTTGAILYAKHAYSARSLDALLEQHKIHRQYLAIVHGVPRPMAGEINRPIGRDRHVSGKYRVSETGKAAVTNYRTLKTGRSGGERVSLVHCELQTGRTHQIRVHLASLGCPVVGDLLYGASRYAGSFKWENGIALHAAQLRFTHPYERETISVDAPLPLQFQAALGVFKLE